jgi:23S rRNA pseudouridine1911/1915/1917 synthase
MNAVVPAGSRSTLTALVRALLGVSNSRARDLVATGAVSVDGRLVNDPVHRPEAGSELVIEPARLGTVRRRRRVLVGVGFESVLFDRDLIVVDKQPGIVTIPVRGAVDDGSDPSLVGLVAAALRSAGHDPRELYVVHRIDRETSGLVVIALHKRACDALREQFRERTVRREYIAWTESVPKPERGALRHLLAERDDSPRMEVVSDARRGKPAELYYRVEAVGDRGARVSVRLVTGRRNQIRVQLAASGCPIVGDRYYGARQTGPGRSALHASRLVLRHPGSGRSIDLRADVPQDLLALDRAMFVPSRRLGSRRATGRDGPPA